MTRISQSRTANRPVTQHGNKSKNKQLTTATNNKQLWQFRAKWSETNLDVTKRRQHQSTNIVAERGT
jgi:hypothetical protein